MMTATVAAEAVEDTVEAGMVAENIVGIVTDRGVDLSDLLPGI